MSGKRLDWHFSAANRDPPWGGKIMLIFVRLQWSSIVLGILLTMAGPAGADPLKDQIAPTGKLRVAIAISPAGGAFWSTKTEAGGHGRGAGGFREGVGGRLGG